MVRFPLAWCKLSAACILGLPCGTLKIAERKRNRAGRAGRANPVTLGLVFFSYEQRQENRRKMRLQRPVHAMGEEV